MRSKESNSRNIVTIFYYLFKNDERGSQVFDGDAQVSSGHDASKRGLRVSGATTRYVSTVHKLNRANGLYW